MIKSYFPEKGSLKSIAALKPSEALKLYSLSHSTLETLQAEYSNDLYFAIDNDLNLDLLPKLYEKVLTTTEADRIKTLYRILYPNYDMHHFSLLAQKANNAVLYGQLFHCKGSRQTKNSIFTATWSVNSSGHFSKQICQINYFIRHSVIMTHTETHQTTKAQHIFCYVSWYEKHSKHDWFGASATICKTMVEDECCYSYIPIQRFLSQCAFGTLPLQFEGSPTETVLVAIPLPSPLYI